MDFFGSIGICWDLLGFGSIGLLLSFIEIYWTIALLRFGTYGKKCINTYKNGTFACSYMYFMVCDLPSWAVSMHIYIYERRFCLFLYVFHGLRFAFAGCFDAYIHIRIVVLLVLICISWFEICLHGLSRCIYTYMNGGFACSYMYFMVYDVPSRAVSMHIYI